METIEQKKSNTVKVSFCIDLDDKLTRKELRELEQNYKELIAYSFKGDIYNFIIDTYNK